MLMGGVNSPARRTQGICPAQRGSPVRIIRVTSRNNTHQRIYLVSGNLMITLSRLRFNEWNIQSLSWSNGSNGAIGARVFSAFKGRTPFCAST